MNLRSPREPERFWGKVDRSDPEGCWEWTGARTTGGYGQVGAGKRGRNIYTHRHAYELTFGPIPKGVKVCHRCDNPPCCNPAHLFLGSQAQNILDAQEKGRILQGEQQPQAKLTEAEVRAIRHQKGRQSQQALAAEYGVHQSTISLILNRRTWRGV